MTKFNIVAVKTGFLYPCTVNQACPKGRRRGDEIKLNTKRCVRTSLKVSLPHYCT